MEMYVHIVSQDTTPAHPLLVPPSVGGDVLWGQNQSCGALKQVSLQVETKWVQTTL